MQQGFVVRKWEVYVLVMDGDTAFCGLRKASVPTLTGTIDVNIFHKGWGSG